MTFRSKHSFTTSKLLWRRQSRKHSHYLGYHKAVPWLSRMPCAILSVSAILSFTAAMCEASADVARRETKSSPTRC